MKKRKSKKGKLNRIERLTSFFFEIGTLRKMRHFYPFNGRTAEIDIYLDDLRGLGLVDFEFDGREQKDKFEMPDFCLVDITQEKFAAGGILAGKKYSDIQAVLDKWGYRKLKRAEKR
jgi:CYTH domain-containing protein